MTSSSRNTSFRSRTDWLLRVVTRSCSFVSAIVILLVLAFLMSASWPALKSIGPVRFFTDESWNPLSDRFYLVPMITGTILTSMGALLLATPLGICSAIFDRFFAPPALAPLYRRLVELLAGIPSVVFGLWGLIVLVPLLAPLGGSGQSLLAATLVLALMILPTIALTSSAALRLVPNDQLAGGAALGLDRWAVAMRIAIPSARGGITAGLVLAASRAVGETMAVVMLAGNVAKMPTSLISPVRTLTGNIALEMGYATESHRSVLFVSGLVLLGAVLAAVLVAELIKGPSR